MSESNRLLYLFPELAYSVELVPTKKPHIFSIKNFHQVNGKFLDDNQILSDNLTKLFKKIEPGSYNLILPDYIFTNTMVNIKEESETKVKEHLKNTILPGADLSLETHYIETNLLTQHGGSFKVQITALEKELLEPLTKALSETSDDHKIELSKITSLSWSIKSVVSLEPSITVVQMGENTYLAQHYIGVDQTEFAQVGDEEKVVEAIKTLKGSEPSIQTIYLLSSSLVEENLKERLEDVLPLQQLATFKEVDSKMPSYVKQVIESGMKTLSIPDYEIPTFSLTKMTTTNSQNSKSSSIPTPAVVGEEEKKEVEVKPEVTQEVEPEKTETQEAEVKPEIELPKPKEDSPKPEEKTEEKPEVVEPKPDVTEPKPPVLPISVVEPKPVEPSKSSEESETPDPDEIDLAQFVNSAPSTSQDKKEPAEEEKTDKETKKEESKPKTTMPENTSVKKVIKDKPGTSKMVRMILVSLLSFLITVGVGVGLGLGFLSLTNKTDVQPVPMDQMAEEPPQQEVQVEEPAPTPLPEVVKEEISILVVNATTKAGYAGEIGDLLDTAGYKKITPKNAKGEYEAAGVFLLLTEDNPALVSAVSADTALTVSYMADSKEVEDPSGDYDAVLVLAE